MHSIPSSTNVRRILTTHFKGSSGGSLFNISTCCHRLFLKRPLSARSLRRCGDWRSEETSGLQALIQWSCLTRHKAVLCFIRITQLSSHKLHSLMIIRLSLPALYLAFSIYSLCIPSSLMLAISEKWASIQLVNIGRFLSAGCPVEHHFVFAYRQQYGVCS